MPAEKCKGTVAKWLNHKGIGFITPTAEGDAEVEDVLVHYSQIKQSSEDGFKTLNYGSEVEYDLEKDPKRPEKMVAVNVTGPDGADCEARVKGKGKGKGSRKGKGKKGKGKGGDKEEESKGDEEEE